MNNPRPGSIRLLFFLARHRLFALFKKRDMSSTFENNGKHEAIARIYLHGLVYTVKITGFFDTEQDAKHFLCKELRSRGWTFAEDCQTLTDSTQASWLTPDWRTYAPHPPSSGVPEMNGCGGRAWTRHVCSLFNHVPMSHEIALKIAPNNDALGAQACAFDRLFVQQQH